MTIENTFVGLAPHFRMMRDPKDLYEEFNGRCNDDLEDTSFHTCARLLRRSLDTDHPFVLRSDRYTAGRKQKSTTAFIYRTYGVVQQHCGHPFKLSAHKCGLYKKQSHNHKTKVKATETGITCRSRRLLLRQNPVNALSTLVTQRFLPAIICAYCTQPRTVSHNISRISSVSENRLRITDIAYPIPMIRAASLRKIYISSVRSG